MTELENIEFYNKRIEDMLNLCLKCNSKEEAVKVLRQYEEFIGSVKIAHINLGYIFEYASEENKKKLYSLFPVEQPIDKDKSYRESDEHLIELIHGICASKFFIAMVDRGYLEEMRDKNSKVAFQIGLAKIIGKPFLIIMDKKLTNIEKMEAESYFRHYNVIREFEVDFNHINELEKDVPELKELIENFKEDKI